MVTLLGINKWLYLNARMIILAFVIINFIDMGQTFYYLNTYGFEHEQNPLIKSNVDIVGVKLFYGLPMVFFMFLLTKLPKIFFNRFKIGFPHSFVEFSKTPFYLFGLLICLDLFISLYWVVLSNQYYLMYALINYG